MKDYKVKLREVLLTFIKVNVCVTLFYLVFYAIFIIKLEIPLKDTLTNFVVPGVVAVVANLIWMRPKIERLAFKKSRNPTFYYIASGGFMLWLMIVSASWLVAVTNPLVQLNHVSDFEHKSRSRFYSIRDFTVAQETYSFSYTVTRSGKNNQRINLDLYFVAPFKQADKPEPENKYWLLKKYHLSESSSLGDAEIDKAFNSFMKSSEKDFLARNYVSGLDHFVRLPHSEETIRGLEAIHKLIPEAASDSVVFFSPASEDLADEEKSSLMLIFISFGSGIAAFLILLIFPKYEQPKRKAALKNYKGDIVKLLSPKTNDVYLTTLLIALNCIIFVVLVVMDVGIMSPTAPDLFRYGGVTYNAVADGEAWRVLTSMFIHAGLIHLFYNMVGLGLAGVFAETQFGPKKYLLLYLSTGIIATIAGIVWDKDTVCVGASGAIFGVFGAILLHGYFTKNRVLLYTIGIYAGASLLMGFMMPGVGNAAHVGGLLSGAIMYLVLRAF